MLCVFFILVVVSVTGSNGVSFDLYNGTANSGLVVISGDTLVPVCSDEIFSNRRIARAVCHAMGLPSDEAANVYPYQFIAEDNVTDGVYISVDCPTNKTEVCTIRNTTTPCPKRSVDEYILVAAICTNTAQAYRKQQTFGSIGVVEASLDGKWGPMCAALNTDPKAAELACKTLNRPSTDARLYQNLVYGNNEKAITGGHLCEDDRTKLINCFTMWQFPCSVDYFAISCDQASDRDIRVLGLRSGLVQIYHNNQWHGVGVDSITAKNIASVVCKSLFPDTTSIQFSLVSSSAPVWLSQLSCQGTEASLYDCANATLPDVTVSSPKKLSVTCENDDYTLRIGTDGLLEILHYGIWGVAFDRLLAESLHFKAFQNIGASLICKENNLPSTLSSVYVRRLPTPRVIWWNLLWCNSSTTTWQQCTYRKSQMKEYSPENYVHIKCEDLDMSSVRHRLVGGPKPTIGIYEISLNGVWGTISNRDLTTDDAKVFCRSAGMPTDNARFVSPNLLASSESKLWFDQMTCTGSESSPLDCIHSYPGDRLQLSKPSSIAAVNCGPAQTLEDLSLRLVDGPNNYTGRLEMVIFGEWVSLCTDGFKSNDIYKICELMNLPKFVTEKISSTSFKAGSGNMWNVEFTCSIGKCYVKKRPGTCDRSKELGIKCQPVPTYRPFPDHDFPDTPVGLIIGCVIGGTAFIVLVMAVAIYLYMRNRPVTRQVSNVSYPPASYYPQTKHSEKH